jgi:hypothetical protein
MTAREWLKEKFPSVFGKPAPPIIMTEWGPVTESARLQAAINMRVDENIKARVETMLIQQYSGDVQAGMAEARRRYPEAYRD